MGTFRLEKYKFLIYLVVPICAVYVYSIPSVHESAIKGSRYIVYSNMRTLKDPQATNGDASKEAPPKTEDVSTGEKEMNSGIGVPSKRRSAESKAQFHFLTIIPKNLSHTKWTKELATTKSTAK